MNNINPTRLADILPDLTVEQKAKAFELMATENATGMSIFWDFYDQLRGLPHNEILSKMAKLACVEALEQVFDL